VRRTRRERAVFDLGFDRTSLISAPTILRGLSKGSEAERAGAKEGALVISAKVPSAEEALAGKGEVELRLGSGKVVRYRPVTRKREALWEPAPCPDESRNTW
jgi:hypothetical protein